MFLIARSSLSDRFNPKRRSDCYRPFLFNYKERIIRLIQEAKNTQLDGEESEYTSSNHDESLK